MNGIALHVNNLVWTGWQEASVTHSIDSVFGTFDLRLTRGGPNGGNPPPVKAGDDCRLSLDGETVITGYINQVSLETDSDGFDLRVRGRDRTALLFKGGVLNSPAEWKGLNAVEIAREIARPFGVAVTAAVDVGAPFAKFTCQPGSTANRAVERLCRHRALYHHADRFGGLILTNADAATTSGDDLTFGPDGNVLVSRFEADLSSRHSDYVIRNQGPATSEDDNNHTEVTARAVDRGMRHYCPRVIVPDEPGDTKAMKALAVAMSALNAGRSRALTHTVAGWRVGETDQLWRINSLVEVRDVVADLEETLLIKNVVLSIGPEAAPTTTLTLAEPSAYALTAEPEARDGGGSE